MFSEFFKEEEVYATGSSRLTDTAYETIKASIRNNEAVGFITGLYDADLTITHISSVFLHNLGYSLSLIHI